MLEHVPELVAIYDVGSGRPQRVAEFQLTREQQVSLTVFDRCECPLARQWYEHGVQVLGEARRIQPSDAGEFMRALLQPFRMSYYHIVDETPSSGDTGPAETP